jgi:hypothetical protein
MTNAYQPHLDPEALLSPQEAAAMLSFSPRKLEADRYAGVGLPYYRVAQNRVRYRRGDIIEYMRAMRVEPKAA